MADTDTKHVGFKVQSTLVSLPCFFLVCDDELVRQTDSAQTKRPVTVVRAHDERVCVCVCTVTVRIKYYMFLRFFVTKYPKDVWFRLLDQNAGVPWGFCLSPVIFS